MKTFIRCFLMFGLLIVLGGCSSLSNSEGPISERCDYLIGKTYRLRRPLFLFKYNVNDRKEIAKLADLGSSATPSDVDEFKRRAKEDSQMYGLMMPGEQIRITKIDQNKSVIIGNFILVYAVVVTGEHQGKSIDVTVTSRSKGANYRAHVDPQYLELVE